MKRPKHSHQKMMHERWYRDMYVSDFLQAAAAFGAAAAVAIARLIEAGKTEEEAREMVREAAAGLRGWQKVKAAEGLKA